MPIGLYLNQMVTDEQTEKKPGRDMDCPYRAMGWLKTGKLLN
jgi:hypothetical protein